MAEAALSFVGLGAQPPTPSWGAMVADGRDLLRVAPWVSFAPGIAIGLAVLGFNLVGDALREAYDPRTPRVSAESATQRALRQLRHWPRFAARSSPGPTRPST